MDPFEARRRQMVRRQIRNRGIRDPAVLEAMEAVPRHVFVPDRLREDAYEDAPLPIGMGQTISQPYMVALMTERLAPAPSHRVLEVGTGSGYQAAVLSRLVCEVHTLERVPSLAESARRNLERAGCTHVVVHVGDGSCGLFEGAPFDGILVTAGSPRVPEPLVEQLKLGGRLVVPIGEAHHQTLRTIVREAEGLREESGTGCVFVPLIGAHGWPAKQG